MIRDVTAPDQAVIPPVVLAGVLEVGRREGLAVGSWFSGTGLDPAALYAPDARVSFSQARTLLRRALDAFPGRAVGLEVGGRDPLLSFGFLGVAMRASKTVGEGLSLAGELHPSVGSLLDAEREDLGDEVSVRFRERWPDPDLLAFLCEESLVSTTAVIRSMLGDATWTPTRLDLAYPAPTYARRYGRTFGCPVHFSSDANRMVFPKELLGRRLPTQHEPMRHAAIEMCRQLLSPHDDRPDIVASVEALVGASLRRPLTMGEVAERLYVTERTLHRRLSDVDERFSSIRDRMRERRATSLLQHTTMHVAGVATEVGFNDAREFRRAYIRWTGRTPQRARSATAS